MIQQAHRFHTRGDVLRVQRIGSTSRGAGCVARCAPKRQRQAQFAVSVSKKVHKSAVVRNRIRRRVYEVIRLEVLPTQPNHDCVVVIYDVGFATMEFERLRAILLSIFKLKSARPQASNPKA